MDPANQLEQAETSAKKNQAQYQLRQARKKLKSEAVVDPAPQKPARPIGRQRVKYAKPTVTEDILSTVDPVPKATSSKEPSLRTNPVVIEPFSAQLDEIDRVRALFNTQVPTPTGTQEHSLQTNPIVTEPFSAQLDEIDHILAQLNT